ncbi:pentatricopeptide repeat-containing protein [Canna indica]|uniref:Pentatricopeptide repeat-containing protein n=1 Tax=Canna indica TaxID=4628 RepID=A0AAQ3Q9F9_9LILI|nr:pentatricopeptide repeat-containing protein [Canna indica]
MVCAAIPNLLARESFGSVRIHRVDAPQMCTMDFPLPFSLTTAAARAVRRRRPFFTVHASHHLRPSTPPSFHNSTLSAPSPELSTSGDAKFSAFCAAIAESSRCRPASTLPSPGSSPSRTCPSAYNSLMKSFSRSGDVDEVLRLFRELRHSHPTPDALCYNTLINSLVSANRLGHAREVFDEMIASGVAPTTSSYTILIKLHCFYPNLIDLSCNLIHTMVQSGCQPDAITYSTLIAGLCRAGRVEEALGFLDQMIEDKLLPTVQAFTCIVHGYCSKGRIEVAKRLVSMMESVGCPPDVVTYSILIEAHCWGGEFDEVEKILTESEKKGWKPNEITFNIYMNGLCKAGKIDKAFQLLEVMRSSALCPTIITLSILFNCLCRDSKIWEAKYLLEKSTELEWEVDVVFYNILMSRFYEIDEFDIILKLLTEMLKKGINPDSCTFTIVIRSLCKAGKLPLAKCIISSRGFVVDVVAFNTFLHEFYMAEEFNEVRVLYANMLSENVDPNKFTYSIMIDTLCREGNYLDAIDCFHRSLKIGFFPDLVIRLNNWLVKGRKLREILNVVEVILSRGLVIDVSIFTSLVTAFCREGYCKSNDLYGLCLIFEKMLGLR